MNAKNVCLGVGVLCFVLVGAGVESLVSMKLMWAGIAAVVASQMSWGKG